MTGAAAWNARKPLARGALSALVLIFGFGGWAVTATLSGAIILSGHVAVEDDLQVVQHPEGGVITDILVTEGARVAAGQVLLRLDGETLHSERAIVESQYVEALARQARLEAEREAADRLTFAMPLSMLIAARPDALAIAETQRRLFATRHQALRQQIARLNAQRDQHRARIAGLNAQRNAAQREAAMLAAELTGQEGLLERGLVQAARVHALRRDVARIDGTLGALTAEIAQERGRESEVEQQVAALVPQRREEAEAALGALGPQIVELAQRRHALERRIAALDLRAPVSGRVHGLRITTPRAVLRPAEPVMQIVPGDRALIMTVRIAPEDIDQVFVGQPALVRFPALHSPDPTDLDGRVTRISADIFTDDRRGERFYRGEITLSEPRRRGGVALLPGMPIEAHLRTAQRTPLDYLTRPLTQYLFRALREG
ncbi:MAG: type 1 secretion system HlyD family membrane fusion component [Rhodobacteraceae bacterium HLUCCA12]|nr:MAG: type 1 secretion system HlyD family membrane fusion component [Rhodobacteraceae bacterium HLUCCA12]